MSSFRYRVVKQHLFSPELGEYVSYGLHAFRVEGERAAHAALVWDISCDPDLVSRLAERCDRLQLDPLHLPDVVRDTLG